MLFAALLSNVPVLVHYCVTVTEDLTVDGSLVIIVVANFLS